MEEFSHLRVGGWCVGGVWVGGRVGGRVVGGIDQSLRLSRINTSVMVIHEIQCGAHAPRHYLSRMTNTSVFIPYIMSLAKI